MCNIQFFKLGIDESVRDITPAKLAQPSRRMTRSMTQDPGLGQDSSIANASKPIISQRITRSRAHMMGAEHQLVSLFLILID